MEPPGAELRPPRMPARGVVAAAGRLGAAPAGHLAGGVRRGRRTIRLRQAGTGHGGRG